jgi:hypothetical protein
MKMRKFENENFTFWGQEILREKKVVQYSWWWKTLLENESCNFFCNLEIPPYSLRIKSFFSFFFIAQGPDLGPQILELVNLKTEAFNLVCFLHYHFWNRNIKTFLFIWIFSTRVTHNLWQSFHVINTFIYQDFILIFMYFL